MNRSPNKGFMHLPEQVGVGVTRVRERRGVEWRDGWGGGVTRQVT